MIFTCFSLRELSGQLGFSQPISVLRVYCPARQWCNITSGSMSSGLLFYWLVQFGLGRDMAQDVRTNGTEVIYEMISLGSECKGWLAFFQSSRPISYHLFSADFPPGKLVTYVSFLCVFRFQSNLGISVKTVCVFKSQCSLLALVVMWLEVTCSLLIRHSNTSQQLSCIITLH